MDDKYYNFQKLARYQRQYTDYRIRLCRRASPVAVIAPHGGKIEYGTSEIATGIAGTEHNLYCFEGIKRQDNQHLHITSSRFDEPRCLDLVSACNVILAIHGCKKDERKVYLGGLDESLWDRIGDELKNSGFETGEPHKLKGCSKNNICNRGRRGKGVQLEISRGLRDDLCPAAPPNENKSFSNFIDAVRRAIS